MLSVNNVLRELSYISSTSGSIEDFLDEANSLIETEILTESDYNKVTSHLRLEILDVERFIKVNELQPVTNPRAFIRDNIPSDDGLLSNKIFGITKDDRAGIFAYIELNDWFIDPSCYKIWTRIDSNIRNIVHGIDTYRIDDRGYIVKDETGKGGTGIDFLRKNINKIKFKSTDSMKRDLKIQYLETNKNNMFIKKYIVIPPFYRDKNTANSRSVGLGGINKLYNDLIIASNALTATQDYMFDASDAMKGRVQEIILNIYDWFCGNTNKNINTELGTGLSGKMGVLRRAAMSKTANFSSRLVITAPELKAEKPEDELVSLDKSAIPLAACIADFRDFVMFNAKRFFENEFMGVETYPIIDDKGNIKYVTPESPEVAFSDERIKKEMERFIHGYNNRFVPIEIPLEGTKEKYYMAFKGRNTDSEDYGKNPESIYHRKLTWCDVFYIACCEAVKDKQILITRFPIDSFSNQFTTGVVVSSTKETEPMYINDVYYSRYPKIRPEDINRDTSNKFVDTMQFSNLYLKGIGGDFDGDQITVKGVYTVEANEELREFMNSKESLIDFGCKPLKDPGADVFQSIYALTKVLNGTKLTTNISYS